MHASGFRSRLNSSPMNAPCDNPRRTLMLNFIQCSLEEERWTIPPHPSMNASRLCHLLYRHPDGLGVAELARLCQVTKRTAQRDLHALGDLGIPLWDDEGDPPRYGIIEGYYLPPIHLSLDDALALFLAARLLARYADAFDPHITAALAKLAGILPGALADHVHATIRELAERPEEERFTTTLNILALGWASRRLVRITHQSAGSENVHEYDLAPYFIEPSATGNATYVIGWASYFDSIRTFKVERILSAQLTKQTYEIPEGFDGPALLRSAWSIEYGELLQEVALRFAANATRRICETIWHPSQTLEHCEDGGCILRLNVAHPEEMVYWVRGWGPQVEVLAPTWMRDQIASEATHTRALYGG
jgi:predicted DNA-binding transcriptional regulator YafY